MKAKMYTRSPVYDLPPDDIEVAAQYNGEPPPTALGPNTTPRGDSMPESPMVPYILANPGWYPEDWGPVYLRQDDYYMLFSPPHLDPTAEGAMWGFNRLVAPPPPVKLSPLAEFFYMMLIAYAIILAIAFIVISLKGMKVWSIH